MNNEQCAMNKEKKIKINLFFIKNNLHLQLYCIHRQNMKHQQDTKNYFIQTILSFNKVYSATDNGTNSETVDSVGGGYLSFKQIP